MKYKRQSFTQLLVVNSDETMRKLIGSIFLCLLTIQVMAQDEIEAKSNLFIQQMLEDYKIIEKDARINRYATSGSTWSKRIDLKSKKLFFNKYDQKDYQEYALTFIYFKDSASCLDARRKYLDNYSLKSGALTNSTKYTGRPPSFNLITNNSIIIFEVSCEGHHMDEKWSWNQIKKKLTLMFGSDESEIIENGCGKPITWKNNKDK